MALSTIDKPLQKRRFWRFRKDDRGAAAVEFALVAPVFFLVLFATIETGFMLFTEYVLQTSVQEAARQVRTGQSQKLKRTAAQFKQDVCELASLIVNCTSNVTVYMKAENDFATLAASVPSYMTIGPSTIGSPSPTSFDCGAPKKAVALIVTYDWKLITPFMSLIGNKDGGKARRIAAFAMFRNEPFPAVAGEVCEVPV